ncbi:MAG: glycoside hydrolase family 127 protein [Sedimentisphaerales bacterium]|nr:glycoside hydrolase family 127 protein [Sedimentisphaerales bacterium]
MRRRQSLRLVLMLAAGVAIGLAGVASAQGNAAAGGFGRGRFAAPEVPEGVNLAVVAVPSASNVSGDTTLGALNDGSNPRSSRSSRGGSYGNWPSRGTQWVQYDWSQPISTNRIAVFWWDDNQGVRLPSTSRLLYWDGNAFVPVRNASGLGVEGNQYNVTAFDEVTTSKLRLEIDPNGTNSTGILEWRVYDTGKSPDFPPSVEVGIDRVVMVGGKTWLSGTVRSLKGETPDAKVVWSKASGPGTVSFENANAAETTATFSVPGQYVLKLTAGEGQMSGSATLKVKVETPPPAERLDVVYTENYKIDNPLWNSRAKALIVGWIPHCIERINDPNLPEGGINNFTDAAMALRGEELPEGHGHRGYVFSNAWVHQTVESMCIGLMVDPMGDPEIIKAQQLFKKTLDDWIPKILAAQEPDGYLQTAFSMRRVSRGGGRRGGQAGPAAYRYSDPPARWTRRGDHEGYVAGYFLESAINHYTLTNGTDTRLYNAAKKLADCWVANLGPGKKDWYDGHQEMEQALVRFGRFVNDMEGAGSHGDSYIQLAKFLLDCRDGGSEYDQSHVPVQQQYEAVGHAVRATYNYSGMADVAAETHDTDYQSAVMSLWDNIVNKKYYITGGIGSGETSEGFGPNYSLRNNAYCESCSTCGLIFFQYKMNLAYHDAKYADLYEESTYNALLGSIDLEGKNFYYQNPLDSRGFRYPWHGCPCCVGNIPRTLLMIPTWTYVKDDSGIYVNLFIGSTINVEKVAGTNVQMVQKTDYPWSGNVSITVNPETPKRFTVYVRVPDRTTSALYMPTPQVNGLKSISVNGSAVNPRIEKGYAAITRDWEADDKIDLVLPMQVQRIKADERIAADVGRVALRYGPLIYSAERIDQDLDKVLPPDAKLTTEFKSDLLDGVLVVKGAWADGSAFMAIPNYARDNRPVQPDEDEGAAAGGARRGRGGSRGLNSIVWIRDQ